MTTKEEYEEALDSMQSIYCDLDNSISAGAKFNNNVYLLYELVNEHFKENPETNYEHYEDEIIDLYLEDLAILKGKISKCCVTPCSECGFINENGDCIGHRRIKEWLKKPYQKPPYKLSQFEYDLLSVHKDYKTYNNIANQIHLFKMREKGYFKDIDTNIPIREILDNCEVEG